MERERNYSERDMDAAYNEGRRDAGKGGGIGFANWIAIGAIIIMVGIMALTFIGYNPFQRRAEAPGAQTQATTPPTSDPLVLENARLRALLAAPQEPSLLVQNVPAGAAPQNLTIAATPVPPTPETGASATPVPPPAQQLIVVHEGGGAPRITGSGACKVAAMGARRCAK